MRFVYLMDPMDRVLWDKDTTFALQRAAQARGHQASHALLRDLFIKDGDVHAAVRDVTVSNDAPHFRFGESHVLRLADVEAVLIRKDPPFDAAYLYATQMLERARDRTQLLNDPRGIRDANEKLYALHFARHMPRTMVSADPEQLISYLGEVGGKGVIKPLDGAGGSGVMMLTAGDKNVRAIVQLLTGEGSREAMLQEYLPAVTGGDKRVLLLDGEILGAINRVPRPDDLRSNIHVGGRVEPCEVTPQERAIVADMAPRLRQDGLVFVGLDFIGEKLTEVNVTSPTGIQELSRHEGRDVATDVIAWIERRAHDLRPDLHSMMPPEA
jgi:glutathione synthase